MERIGCRIDLLVIDPYFERGLPWRFVHPDVSRLATVVIRDHRRIGNFYFNAHALREWLLLPLRLLYLALPDRVRRFVRNRTVAIRRGVTERMKRAFTLDDPVSPEEEAFVRGWIRRYPPGIVIVNFTPLATLLDLFEGSPTILTGILTHDVLHRRIESFERSGIPIDVFSRRWDREGEGALLRKARLLIAIQKEDAAEFERLSPMSDVIEAPVAFPLSHHPGPPTPGRCLFVGSATNHNIYGIRWFISEVWPTIRQRHPTSTLHVCGSVCREIEEEGEGIILRGLVEDLDREYAEAEVCVIPLLAGSGLKIKLGEALAHGRACVSTSIGLQGFEEVAGDVVLCADDPASFAQSVSSILASPERRLELEARAHAFVAAHLVPSAAYRALETYLGRYLDTRHEEGGTRQVKAPA
ncbi:MAG: glycosyltransferase [Deltaproteobacteria bacterium]|nr:MAG: glycosyltransferase [Deltaproteobacteria bacterium]